MMSPDMQWITIPGGCVTLGPGGYLADNAPFDVAPFDMARYPVTNAQYAVFIAAGGYAERAWWTDRGWQLRERENWTAARFWTDRAWTREDNPVVGMSWYEARAFCRWLSALTGRTVTLPTEQQWQRAAQGDDGREFPWGGDDPDELRCNWNRAEDGTTPVNRYPDGASPFGVMDMSGNVWEWCLTGWESGRTDPDGGEVRVLRGGSWSSDSPISLRAANRNASDPNARLSPAYRNYVTVGFRCVRLRE
jgi:formylglycine-generating enzyme required for sulfatase activity